MFALAITGLALPLYGEIPPAPNPPTLVADLANVLQTHERQALEQKLTEYAVLHGTQIVILTIREIGDMEPGEFADRVAEKWGIGQAGMENGILILVNPAEVGGSVHISVGYGLEGVIPDIIAKRIVDQELVPNFRAGNFFAGLENSTNVLMKLAAGEFTADEYLAQKPPVRNIGSFVFLIFFAILIVLMSRSRRSQYTAGKQIPFWTLLFLMGNSGSRNTGAWGQFSSGSGRFGSGGGFGGFGGGSFGGGGAGGSW